MPDPRIERARLIDLEGTSDRLRNQHTDNNPARLAVTTLVNAYPVAANVFYGCNPVEIDGTEMEGAEATYTSDTSQVLYAFNLGNGIPPQGTYVIVQAVGGRWVFRYDQPAQTGNGSGGGGSGGSTGGGGSATSVRQVAGGRSAARAMAAVPGRVMFAGGFQPRGIHSLY